MAKALKKRTSQPATLPVRVRTYLDGVVRELRLVTWPGKQQVRATTLVVLVTVFAFAVFFGVVDYVLAWGQRLLYQTFT
ncbi:MAG: preprotein translocase subunit SecE [Bryobacterales bacterium]|nr:preprotein translocase subunit SecE [Bryobacterales bacterium]MDE0264480.1 preprotein translocase subunit SecE [Bryobacterales bacterium]MDE0622413.1 preprotein translocase subunit SecE [Bryobacterales bacterium]